jgi:hypothetical protein
VPGKNTSVLRAFSAGRNGQDALITLALRLDKINTVPLSSSRVKMDNYNSTNKNRIYNNSNSSSSEVIQEGSIMMETNFTRKDQETVVVVNATSSAIHRQRRVMFIPFPHNTLGSGTDMECKWETLITPPSNNNKNNITTKYDSTQLSAFAEGVCIPPNVNTSIHVFSSNEARTCLQSKKVIISGDSYMKQLFIVIRRLLVQRIEVILLPRRIIG